MKKVASIVLFLMFFVSSAVMWFTTPVFAAENYAENYDVYLQVQSFTWKEFINGSEILEESGPIYALGGLARLENNSLTFRARGEVFGGSIIYDGQTQAGTPVESDTVYAGIKLEGDVGWKKLVEDKASIEPFAGIGFRVWNRDIQSTSNATGVTEKWTSTYARLGLRGDSALSDKLTVFAEGGMKFPFYNSNSVDDDDISLEPKSRVSGFAEAGLKWNKLWASIFYEGLRFDKSEVEPIGGGWGVYQPKSEADIFGLNAGYSF